MHIDSTVEDLVAKIMTHAKVQSSKVRLYKMGYNRSNFVLKSVGGKFQAQKLFGNNNYEESLLVRFSDEMEPKPIYQSGEIPVFVQLTDEDKQYLSEQYQ